MSGASAPPATARLEVLERLSARREEIEAVALTRVRAISDPREVDDPGYLEGLRVALSAALDYGLTALAEGPERPPPLPPALLAQAGLAARSGVSLDTVLRRYFAGYSLLGDFLLEEVERDDVLSGAELQRLLRSQASLFDRLLVAVSEAYAKEANSSADTSEERRAEQVRALLAGELVDGATLGYELEAAHLGLVAVGSGVAQALAGLAASLDRRLLIAHAGPQVFWAWLGGRRPLRHDDLRSALARVWPERAILAVGEPAEGLDGWRFTHRQARAALQVARRRGERLALYSEAALVASALHDDLLATSLRRMYLDPLRRSRDGGETERRTLRAYFAASRNVSSTAAALGVSRRTVTSRLRAIEERLGRQLDGVALELELALRLDELGGPAPGAS